MRKNRRIEDLGDLLDLPIIAVLATRYEDGSILLSPVWHEWRDGGFTVVVLANDVKSKHLARDPRATIIVTENAPPFRAIEVRGEVTVEVPLDLHETTRRLAIRYLGELEGREYAKTNAGVDMERIRLVPGGLRVWDFSEDSAQ